MKLLLDTHVFLWLMYDSCKLSKLAYQTCKDSNNSLYLSIASVWEMQIKHQIGKLELSVSLEEMIEEESQTNGLQILPIELKHISALYNFPFYHKDPFDRIIIAQSVIDNVHLVSADQVFKKYPVKLLW